MSGAGLGHRAATANPAAAEPYRVMIVDDSAVIRGLMVRWLEPDPAVDVVASVSDGKMALASVGRADPDVIVLDIEMPGMDGMTLLPKLLEHESTLKVIMASTLTRRNADISFRALAMGAADYIPKPTSRRELHGATGFRRELVDKIKALGAARRRQAGADKPLRRPGVAVSPHEAPAVETGEAAIPLRKPGLVRPNALAIGSSTGGPNALLMLFEHLKRSVQLPIFITQHMPPMFTKILAENIARVTGAPSAEALDGERVERGHIYVAPGDYHLRVEAEDGDKYIRLSQSQPENFCRPAVDPMLRSLATAYGGHILGVILTGMGSDGLIGAETLVAAGGTIIAQDEASSVVWGMPGAVATGGLCNAVLALNDIGPAVFRLISGDRA